MIESILEFLKSAIVQQIIHDPLWATLGLMGQFLFSARFILQWIASEYKKKSHVPTSFWILSLVGTVIMFAYSVHIKNPIFMLAFSLNMLIYVRNLHLIHRHNINVKKYEER